MYHNNIIGYCTRPYSSVEEMNEDMIAKWNSVVKPEDFIYYLGDFSLSFRPIELFSFRLNGNKYLIPGNHDFCHSGNKKSKNKENQDKWIKKYGDYGWAVLPEQITLNFPEIGIVNLCHLPYSIKNDSDVRYNSSRPVDDHKILLCGHVHEKWQTTRSLAGTLMVNVGVDVNNFCPISENEVVQRIKNHR